jgi:hypothetical protein
MTLHSRLALEATTGLLSRFEHRLGTETGSNGYADERT